MSVRKMLNIKKIMALLLAVTLVVISAGSSKAYAAAKKDTGKYTPATFRYSVEVTDYSTTLKSEKAEINVITFYELFQLEETDAAAKKINKFLKKLAKEYKPAEEGGILSMAEEVVNAEHETEYTDEYSDYVNTLLISTNEKYLSLGIARYWYAGGVSNVFNTGYTFDRTTGKKAKISDVTGISLKKIKKQMLADIEASGEFAGFEEYYTEAINSKKASDFNFYIQPGRRCVVTFDPYELGWGGWSREYVIYY